MLPLVFGAGCVTLAVVLTAHRDLGAGLLPPRTGPASAHPRLGHPLGLAVRLQRGGLLAWSASVFVLGAVYGALGKDIEDFVADSDTIRDFLAGSGTDLVASFLGTSLLTMALVGSGFAVQAANRLRTEEMGVRAEPVLAAPCRASGGR